jgi:hypothetical protein
MKLIAIAISVKMVLVWSPSSVSGIAQLDGRRHENSRQDSSASGIERLLAAPDVLAADSLWFNSLPAWRIRRLTVARHGVPSGRNIVYFVVSCSTTPLNTGNIEPQVNEHNGGRLRFPSTSVNVSSFEMYVA